MLIEQLKNNYIFAVIRGKNAEDALEIAKNAVLGGIKNLEITFSTPNAEDVILQLKKLYKDEPEVVVGAGTVMNLQQAESAKKAGAKFLVSPYLSEEIANYANENGILYSPGCGTVTEVVHAMQLECKIIKLFPGGTLGTGFVKSIHGPIPEVNVMPSGGVSIQNIKEWKKAGACAVGVGGELTKNIATDGYDSVRKIASEFVKSL